MRHILNYKNLIFVLLLIFTVNNINCQTWTWVNGSSSQGSPGKYGIKGVASASNTPGARTNGVTWTDTIGNLWLFGGYGKDSLGNVGSLNDLWKYDVSVSQWVWINGSKLIGATPKYGIQGVSNSINTPGARAGHLTWRDLNGDLWLLGGGGLDSLNQNGMLNDLWKYTISTNQWTWMKGGKLINQPPICGIQNVPNASNVPGSRQQSCAWTDNAGNFWLYGGTGFNTSFVQGGLTDVWKYDPTTNMWTWMKGSQALNVAGTWGTIGNYSVSNNPGARTDCYSWKDSNGNVYIYGGFGVDFMNNNGTLNDLWKYNISSNQWVWLFGSNLRNQAPVFGTLNTYSSTNKPGAMGGGLSWIDSTGNFWMGFGVATNNFATDYFTNFLWKYNPNTNQWIWTKGVNYVSAHQIGNYGTINVPASTNTPGGRNTSSAWSGKNGKLWLFGGYAKIDNLTGLANDLWRLDVCYSPASIVNTTPLSNLTICSGSSASLSAVGSGSISWQNIYGATLGTGNLFTTPTLTAGATFLLGDSASCLKISTTISVNPIPTVNISPGFTTVCAGKTLNLIASGANSYSWSNTNTTNVITINPLITTSYTVIGTSASTGCSNFSIATVSVNPNPTLSITPNNSVTCSNQSVILNASGASSYTWNTGPNTFSCVVTPTSNSTYTVKGTALGCTNIAIQSISVNPSPTITINNGTICLGNSFTINPTGANTYTIQGGNSVVSPTSNSSYTIIGTSSAGCLSNSSATLNITVNPLPTISVNSGSVCSGNSFTIIPNGANTYTIEGGNSVVNPTISSTYSVIGSSSAGCISNNITTSTVNVISNPTITVNSGSICSGSFFTITPSGASSYSFSSLSPIVSPTVNTSYSVTGTSSLGCISSNSAIANVFVYSLPTVSCIASNTIICAGNTLILNGSGANSYSWSNNVINGSPFSPTSSNIFTVTGIDLSSGCSNTAAISITVNPIPTLNFSISNNVICTGQSSTITVSGANTYTWNTTSTSSIIIVNPNVTTNYTVNATDMNGCNSNAVVTQSVSTCAGFKEMNINQKKVRLFPNPSNSCINILCEEKSFISIINNVGELLFEGELNESITKLDISNWTSGLYLITFHEGNNYQIIKFIKN